MRGAPHELHNHDMVHVLSNVIETIYAIMHFASCCRRFLRVVPAMRRHNDSGYDAGTVLKGGDRLRRGT